jgi:glycogen synthase
MRILMIVMSGVTDDARVMREARTLAHLGHQVEVLGDRRPAHTTPVDQFRITWVRRTPGSVRSGRFAAPRWVRWLLLPEHRRRQQRAFSRAVLRAKVERPDVVHAHDLTALGPAHELRERHRAILVYDAHECWTGRRLEGRPTPFATWRERRRERRIGATAAAVLTVGPALARWLQRTYGWHDVTVVANTFPCLPDRPSVPAAPSGLLYAGRLDRKRDLTTVLHAAARSPLPIEVLGGGDERVGVELRAAGLTVRPPVPIDDVDEHYRRNGIALVTLDDSSLNHRLALPNKVFHAVRAGVPVVAADLPELGRLVRAYRLGATYRPGDVDSLLQAIATVIAGYDDYLAAVADARPSLCWERDAQRLRDVYDRIGETC